YSFSVCIVEKAKPAELINDSQHLFFVMNDSMRTGRGDTYIIQERPAHMLAVKPLVAPCPLRRYVGTYSGYESRIGLAHKS
ncbi:MAG: hypothetical protein QF437_12670, partial [Planctomycetota bacterium]|nr:hypothetical protein [Planctomycetota bacterium]